jgi:hypothetical protein
MEIAEITGNLKTKINEAKKISGLNSKHFGFKNWHTTTLNLLRNLPSNYLPEINDFKKLAFEDTKFHRGNRYFSQTDNTKYGEDLESAIVILKKILDLSKAEKPKKSTDKTSKTDSEKKPPIKKPSLKKPGDILTDSIKKAKKPKTSRDVRSPAKTGKAPGRKKKPKK